MTAMNALRVDGNADAIEDVFIGSLKAAQHVMLPYDYWLLADALPEDIIDAITELPFAPPGQAVFDGRRESNNSTRVYFSPEQQARFPVCRDVVQAFGSTQMIEALEQATRADLSTGTLRVEYCQDVDGFWLEPHLDISVKQITMLIYLSDEPELRDAGTDVYDDSGEHKRVATSPYGKGKGLIFVPGKNTWHGFTKRPIYGVRKSIIINFVAPQWESKKELAY